MLAFQNCVSFNTHILCFHDGIAGEVLSCCTRLTCAYNYIDFRTPPYSQINNVFKHVLIICNASTERAKRKS